MVICTNKELILNEKDMTVRKNVDVVVNVSEPIYPKNYKSKEEYFEAVQQLWDKTWKEAYDCKKPQPASYPLPGCNIYHCQPPKERIWIFRVFVIVLALWIIKKIFL